MFGYRDLVVHGVWVHTPLGSEHFPQSSEAGSSLELKVESFSGAKCYAST